MAPFDIFRQETDNSVHWICAAASMEEAERVVKKDCETTPTSYIVVDQRSGNTTVIAAGERRAAQV